MTDPAVPVDWQCSEYSLAVLLLAQLKAHLEAADHGVEHTVVHPGTSVPGYAELGGDAGHELAWTRVVDVVPVEQKRPDLGQYAYTVQLELGVWRCYPTPEQNAAPWDTIDTSARLAIDDAARMRAAIRDFAQIAGARHWPGVWSPLATSGGLHGGRMLCRVHALLGGYPDDVIPPIGVGGA